MRHAIQAGALAAVLFVAAPAAAIPVLWAGNGHYYEFRHDGGVTFATARAAALAATHAGFSGYLATVTSQAEQDFLNSIPGSIGWSSGSDAAVEGAWRWLDGPEAGTLYFLNGVTQTYSAWNNNEPNSFQGEEDYMVLRFGQGGGWNDLPFNSIQGYYVEFSAVPATGGVPEPATWALTILGFGAAGAALRRRRLQAV
jgi:hypothetical protein